MTETSCLFLTTIFHQFEIESETGDKPSNQKQTSLNNRPVAQGNDKVYRPRVINTMSKNNANMNIAIHTLSHTRKM